MMLGVEVYWSRVLDRQIIQVRQRGGELNACIARGYIRRRNDVAIE